MYYLVFLVLDGLVDVRGPCDDEEVVFDLDTPWQLQQSRVHDLVFGRLGVHFVVVSTRISYTREDLVVAISFIPHIGTWVFFDADA